MSPDQVKKKRIGVLRGGLSAERDVSLDTGQAVLDALIQRGYNIVDLDVGRDICSRLDEEGVEIAFIALHGTWGEDGCIQGLLECLGVPYTGSGVQSSAMAMDKDLTKRLARTAGIPTPDWCYPASLDGAASLGLPAVVKPNKDGSSVDLTIVRAASEMKPALDLAGDAMAEAYIPGRELSVGVLGHGDDALCLGSVEIRAKDGHYDYEAKYNSDETEYLAPAPVPGPVLERLESAAMQMHRLLGCHGGTRTDFRWDGQGEVQMLEINTIPGMTSHSLLPMVARLKGLDYGDLCERLLWGASLKVQQSGRGTRP